MTEYHQYQHVEKASRESLEYFMHDGRVFVQPKIDGTNAVVGRNDGGIWVGKRKNVMGEGDDNRGVKKYVLGEARERFERFFDAHPGMILYGEWLVSHTIKHYSDDAWNRLYVFDVVEEGVRYVPPTEYGPWLEECGIDHVPSVPLADLELDTGTDMLDQLRGYAAKQTYLMQDGYFGEGIVIKDFDLDRDVRDIAWAKVVAAEFKAAMHKDPLGPSTPVEEVIVTQFLTDFDIFKERDRIVNDCYGGSVEAAEADKKSFYPRVMGAVLTSFLEDNIVAIYGKHKGATVSFPALKRLVAGRVRRALDW